nr:RHS repeat-associated core domain-containing protein [Clostridium novyi]
MTNNKDHVGYKNPYRYRGYRYDTETGLYYLNSRYYNSEWGRFVNADALAGKTGELLGHNTFTYCKNNPINMCDENGCFPQLIGTIGWSNPYTWIGACIIAVIHVAVSIYIHSNTTSYLMPVNTIKKAISNATTKARVMPRRNKKSKHKYLTEKQWKTHIVPNHIEAKVKNKTKFPKKWSRDFIKITIVSIANNEFICERWNYSDMKQGKQNYFRIFPVYNNGEYCLVKVVYDANTGYIRTAYPVVGGYKE